MAERLLSGEPIKESRNAYDWLGPGAYFWEANPLRGFQFATELKNAPWGATINTPTVVGAVIDLGLCLDLTTSAGVEQVLTAHKAFMNICAESGNRPPKNSKDKLRRPLDCAVFTTLHDIRKHAKEPPVDTVRGIFVEGDPIFAGSGCYEKTHIQICVCNPSCIKGMFRVGLDQLS